MRFLPRSFRGQLVLLFLMLTLLPSVVLTALVTRQLLMAVDKWESESVRNALTGSFRLSRDLIARLENDLRQRAQLVASDPALDPSRRDDALAERLASAYNLDFAQLYTPDGSLRFEATRDPLIAAPGPLADVAVAAGGDASIRDRQRHVLAIAIPLDDGGERAILVVGIYLDREFYRRLDELSNAVELYHGLRALIAVYRWGTLAAVGLALAALAAAAILVARALARRLSRPVESLGRGMEAVARGERAVRIEPGGGEEFERLIATFNAMSAELVRSRELLAQAERQTAWRDVARRVAHEMRNALTPITFSLHRVGKEMTGLPEDRREVLRPPLVSVLEEVEGLKRLAASFSELARLPAPELREIDLVGLLRGCVAGAADDRVGVTLRAPEGDVTIRGDASLLRQAVNNLLRNAAEAIEGRGAVGIVLRRAGGGVEIDVEDDGPGWRREDRESLLEPYVTTREQGTGLGLSLVRRTVLQHGGTITLADRPGGGARVTLFLPSAPAAPAPPADGDTAG